MEKLHEELEIIGYHDFDEHEFEVILLLHLFFDLVDDIISELACYDSIFQLSGELVLVHIGVVLILEKNIDNVNCEQLVIIDP